MIGKDFPPDIMYYTRVAFIFLHRTVKKHARTICVHCKGYPRIICEPNNTLRYH